MNWLYFVSEPWLYLLVFVLVLVPEVLIIIAFASEILLDDDGLTKSFLPWIDEVEGLVLDKLFSPGGLIWLIVSNLLLVFLAPLKLIIISLVILFVLGVIACCTFGTAARYGSENNEGP